MATYSELGQKAKAKYPQYSSMSDEEVGMKLAEKYPQYKEQVKQQAVVQPKDERTFADKAAGFLGLGNTLGNIQLSVGAPLLSRLSGRADEKNKRLFEASRGLIEQARNEPDLIKKKQLLDQSRKMDTGIEGNADKVREATNLVTQTGNVSEQDLSRGNTNFAARRGVGQSGELFSYLAPGTKELKAIATGARGISGAKGVLARVGEAALSSGIQGIGQGVAKASETANSLKEAASTVGKTTAASAGSGATIQTGFEGIGALSHLLSGVTGKAKDAAIGLYKSTLKENKAAENAIKRQGGVESMIKKANALKLPKTKDGMEKALREYSPEFNQKVSRALEANKQASGKIVDMNKLIDQVENELQTLNRPETRTEFNQAMDYINDVRNTYGKQNANVVSTNRLRQSVDEVVGSLPYDDASGKKLAMKHFATQLRNTVKDSVPETKQYFSKYSLMSDLVESMQKEPKFSLPELFGAMAAGAPGLAFSGPVGIGSSLAGLGITKAIRSPGLKRAASGALQKIGKTSVITPQLSTAGRQAATSLISAFAQQSANQ